VARQRQRGTVLIVSLLLLLILTILATDAMRIATFDIALAGNVQAQSRALARAEEGLSEAEDFIATNFPSTPAFDWSTDADDGLYMPGEVTGSAVTFVDWSAADGAYQTGGSNSRYTVEYLGAFSTGGGSLTVGAGSGSDQRFLYLITARGETAGGSVRYVQSVYATGN
jgi:type IV pilus assembly protein PilX